MKAKDTVMGNLAEAIIKHPDLPMGQAVAIEQAEISFKAGEQLALEKQGQAYLEGKQAGIREVVEWIKEVNKSGDFYYSFDQAELEAKLKEWGIE